MIDLLHDNYRREKQGGDEEALALIGAHTADFVAINDIGSIVFIDTSARNARLPITAAMNQLYPDHAVDYYFLNPAGLVEEDSYYEVQLMNDADYGALVDGINQKGHQLDRFIGRVGVDLCHALISDANVKEGFTVPGWPRSQEDIRQALVEKYNKMLRISANTSSKNTLIFDQCAHRGLSMQATKETLEAAFPDRVFYTGVVDLDTQSSSHTPDLTVLHPEYFKPLGCRYFGRYDDGSQIGQLSTNANILRNDRQKSVQRRHQLATICRRLDYS